MPIALTLREYYASAPVGVYMFQTLELYHPRFGISGNTHYITNSPVDVDAMLETGKLVKFSSLPFVIKLPSRDGNGRQDLSVQIDNIAADIILELENAALDYNTPIKVVFREYTSDNLNAPGNDPIELMATEVDANEATVNITASRADVLNKLFPSLLFTTIEFPGLDR